MLKTRCKMCDEMRTDDQAFTVNRAKADMIFRHARESLPFECCGLVGGNDRNAKSVYPLQNVAANRLTNYEIAPQDLFATQRLMRERGETLLAIYHSHPHDAAPVPSKTDVRLAFYPAAVYLIVGFTEGEPVIRAFHIYEREDVWEETVLRVVDDTV